MWNQSLSIWPKMTSGGDVLHSRNNKLQPEHFLIRLVSMVRKMAHQTSQSLALAALHSVYCLKLCLGGLVTGEVMGETYVAQLRTEVKAMRW